MLTELTDNWAQVQQHKDRMTRRALYRIGGYGRHVMKRLIRKRSGTSSPGSPPHSHIGHLRNLISFHVEWRRRDVVMGPKLFTPKRQADKPGAQLLNEGGVTTLRWKNRQGQVIQRKAVFRARPYVDVAMGITRTKVPEILKQSAR